MLCEKCKKNMATTHIKTVINGKAAQLYLCDECAQNIGIGNSDIMFDGVLDKMLFNIINGNMHIGDIGLSEKCPNCGTTFSEISKSGKVGCDECYNAFKERMLPYIKRIHGSVEHIGKKLNSQEAEDKGKLNETESLKKELARLIDEEKFEEAAIVRDKIRALEGEN